MHNIFIAAAVAAGIAGAHFAEASDPKDMDRLAISSAELGKRAALSDLCVGTDGGLPTLFVDRMRELGFSNAAITQSTSIAMSAKATERSRLDENLEHNLPELCVSGAWAQDVAGAALWLDNTILSERLSIQSGMNLDELDGKGAPAGFAQRVKSMADRFPGTPTYQLMGKKYRAWVQQGLTSNLETVEKLKSKGLVD